MKLTIELNLTEKRLQLVLNLMMKYTDGTFESGFMRSDDYDDTLHIINAIQKGESKKLWAVYKANKSGEICDSPYVWYFNSEVDAKAAAEKMQQLKEDDGKDEGFAPHPGWEFRAYWTYEKVEPKTSTFEEFMQNIKEGTLG